MATETARLMNDHKVQEFISEDYNYHLEDWEKIRDCISGERAIKKRSTRYLPMLPGHHKNILKYRAYLERAPFYNACQRTLEGLVGSIFRRDPVFLNLTDEQKRALPWNKSMTRDGEDFTTTATAAATEVIAMGRYGILLDRGSSDNAPLFAATYKAEHILTYSTRTINGREHLDMVALYERQRHRSTANPLSWEYEEKIRVLELDENNQYFQWIWPDVNARTYPRRNGALLNFIPFIFIGPKSLSPQIQKSLLLDIANMNLSHFRSYAALEHGRHFTAMPVYVAKYDQDTASPTATPNDTVNSDDEGTPTYELSADAVWEMGANDEAMVLEYRGAGLKYIENGLEKKEAQIQALGGRLISAVKGAPAQAAVSYDLQSLGDTALLLSVSRNLGKAFTKLMRWWLWWDGTTAQPADTTLDEDLPTIRFSTNFNEQRITPRELRSMQSIYERGLLPIDVLYHTFHEAGILPNNLTLDQYKALLSDPEQVPALDDRPPG